MKVVPVYFVILVLMYSCSLIESINEVHDGFVQIDEANLYYTFTGQGDTLVVLHGGPGLSHQYVKPQLDSLLSNQFTLLYYDQRASGWSNGEKDSLNLNMSTYISDLEEIRSHFGISKMNLIGHSFGGLLAMYYGVQYPERLNSLVLIDTDAASYELRTPYQVKMIDSRLSNQAVNFLDSMESTNAFIDYDPKVWEQYYKVFLTSYFANPADTAKIQLGFDSISVPKINRTNSLLRADLGNYDIHNKLGAIKCRTLIMQGTESVFSVEGAQAIHENIVNSELHLFENCGHFEYIEAPNKFKALVTDFYKKI